jgi:glycosyltransferase involved in cell wall biosynthesis
MRYGVTIAIKALNEEKNISRALESAVSAIGAVGGEVLLSDSGSVDATVEIAMQWPVRIVQLSNPSDKCCGAGAQLAFQAAEYKYLYLMDADMVVHPNFLRAGIAYLEQNGRVAGVGGMLREQNTQNNQFKILAKSLQTHPDWLPGQVGRLDGGGLYRMSAIHEAGYFGDRNLHAFEEFDLAARLRSRGWTLCRIAEPAVDHFGHKAGSYALLLRRVRSGYSRAAGEVLRAALGQPHFGIVASDLTHIRNGLAVLAWVGMLLAAAAISMLNVSFLVALFVLAVLPILLLSIRRRSLSLGVYSLASWLVSAIGMVDGFFRHRVDPRVPLQYTVLK